MTEWKKKLAMADSNVISRVVGMLGLAMKAGKVVIGTEQVIAFLGKGKLKLVLVSGSASDGTKKKMLHKCEFYKTRLSELDIETDELGRLLGKTYTPAVVGVTDENFACAITKIMDSENTQ
jgi:ribosomal protein L7Ae-like RNA K-turn-binding protein